MSCPNVETGCISIGTDAGETRALVERCRAETDVPVLVKLSPSVADVAAIATAAAEGGAHGLVLINTVRGIAIDRDRLRPLLGGGGGGLSGPAVKPVGLHAVYHAWAATGLPIIGMGGVAIGAGLHRVSRRRRKPGRNWHRAVRRPRAARAAAARSSARLLRRHGARRRSAISSASPTHRYQAQLELDRFGREFRLFIPFSRGCTRLAHGYNRPLP